MVILSLRDGFLLIYLLKIYNRDFVEECFNLLSQIILKF